jgi:cytochrome bd-type quinol oxidase subunit 2
MKSRMDADVARLLRIILLVLAGLFTGFGLFVMPLVPGDLTWNWTDFVFRASPLLIATFLMLPAAWLRQQEALDPAYEVPVANTFFNSRVYYGLFFVGVFLIAALAVASLT